MCNKFKFKHRELHPYWSSHIREFNSKEKDDDENVPEVIKKDILAISTEYLKFIFYIIRTIYDRIKKTKFYRILTTTTQPAHVIVMLAALLIAASIHSSRNFNSNSNNITCKFIYAASTAAHFGSQIWMTFASGLSLYFSLPRHHFGEVQKVLFPLYFTLTSILSLITLTAHLHLFDSLETTFILAACFFIEFYVRLYLCDPLVRLICAKNEMEARHGVGMEVGKLAKNSSLFESLEYLSIHRQFRRLHMCIAFSNIACIAFSTAHLYVAVSHL